MSDMKTVALIPARGGSKRLPGKNIMDFCGKPLLAWSILQAQKSLCFGNDIYVSTDCEEIALEANEYGAKVIERPAFISQDKTSTLDVVKHFKSKNLEDENVILLQPTNPLRKIKNIIDIVEALKFELCESIVTCYEIKTIDYHSYKCFDREILTSKCISVTGLIYGAIHGTGIGSYVSAQMVEPWQSHEIDYPEDVPVVEALFTGMGLDKEVL
jgi:CMP-N-acetylneuraminic acid synthetase